MKRKCDRVGVKRSKNRCGDVGEKWEVKVDDEGGEHFVSVVRKRRILGWSFVKQE